MHFGFVGIKTMRTILFLLGQ
ncbi:Protein of unknown function [Bacillus mobilis]|nr:Protein of unknown function [Bacillus mobilis]